MQPCSIRSSGIVVSFWRQCSCLHESPGWKGMEEGIYKALHKVICQRTVSWGLFLRTFSFVAMNFYIQSVACCTLAFRMCQMYLVTNWPTWSWLVRVCFEDLCRTDESSIHFCWWSQLAAVYGYPVVIVWRTGSSENIESIVWRWSGLTTRICFSWWCG